MKILYTGLFVDSRELHEKIKNISGAGRLEQTVPNPHVTLTYYREQPETLAYNLIGKIYDIEIIGYACDGKNEGVKVRLIKPTKDLEATIEEDRTLHITISLADGARAVDTGKLNFEKIDPIRLTGVFGVFRSGDEHPDCGAPGNAFSGKYIVPFSIGAQEDGKAITITSDEWIPEEIMLRYLASYIKEVFSSDNGIMRAYTLSEDIDDDVLRGYKGRYYPLYRRRTKTVEHFRICDIELFCFATGVCFLVMSVGFDRNADLDMIADLSAALAYFFEIKDPGTINEKETAQQNTAKKILDIVEKNIGREIDWFASTENSKCNVFLRYDLVSEGEGAADYEYAYRLSRGFKAGANVSGSSADSIAGKVYRPIDDRFWMVDSNGLTIIMYSDKVSDINFIRNVLPENVDTYYFAEYLLALHERESFLYYNTEAVRNWDNTKRLIELKKEILKLDIWSTYNAVSTDAFYQELYDKLYKELRLEQLETDVEEVVSKAKEYDDDMKEKRTNSMLTAIGLLAIFSALVDGTDFVKKFSGSEAEALWGVGHWIVYLIVLGVIIYSVKSFTDKK